MSDITKMLEKDDILNVVVGFEALVKIIQRLKPNIVEENTSLVNCIESAKRVKEDRLNAIAVKNAAKELIQRKNN